MLVTFSRNGAGLIIGGWIVKNALEAILGHKNEFYVLVLLWISALLDKNKFLN